MARYLMVGVTLLGYPERAVWRMTAGSCQHSPVAPIAPALRPYCLRVVALTDPTVQHVRIQAARPLGTYRAELQTRVPSMRHWSPAPPSVPLRVAPRAHWIDPAVSVTQHRCPPVGSPLGLVNK